MLNRNRIALFCLLTAAVLMGMNGLPAVFAQAEPCEVDTDTDGICDDADNCPDKGNPGQEDTDEDGVGDACDDDDGDGILDADDTCPASDTSTDLFIDKCDTGVVNSVTEDGCTKADEVAACAADARNHGQFVRCVALLARGWKANGEINGIGKVIRCAARADIPPTDDDGDDE